MSAREAAVDSPWLIVHEARNARVRLFCFHYAGATASIFRTWPGGLPDWVEVVAVQLPGREYRLGEPLIEQAEPIVEALADVVPPLLDLPYAFFGHSMGALIAFDLAHLLRARGFAQPLLFVASGRSAPRFRWRDAGIQTLPDDAFIAAVRDYNGTPEALIADPALRDLWLPRLRADLTISATYRYVESTPLDCPMLVLHGSNDGLVSDAGLSGWLAETIGAVRYVGFSGGHFFMHGEEGGVLAEVRRELERVLARAAQDGPHGTREPAARMGHLTEESET
ncbi:thioesterase II family protein [Burkholderia thailandensis]|uniref:BarC n=1 Tax=Burkholderia thailandensis (strain ATCC 700388 / DSM 13276 / CCUG 48851 / CIP 106301 / E264) TaxID=271848 RepID=Q2T7T1_BURTA|nr:thioesterase domain-containing protein [Burkholderia thailandensis]ABC36167.1 BarC [Burkholderia thailandensis E264]AHI74972.1 thioesterase domain protein [Burkholderia thailandensis 2002721723]AHI80632.1 thioesterase domain protein [Burkholderia thailandensis E444]AIC90931.1 thioesterase domain protein [Burkholderia thailandensis USAMRU Malaysia \